MNFPLASSQTYISNIRQLSPFQAGARFLNIQDRGLNTFADNLRKLAK